MNIVGYLITLSNIQSFQNAGGSIKDISVRVSECQVLLDELKRQPDFILDNFKNTSYNQVNNIGKFISNRLHDYIFKGQGDPKDEAVVLTIYFNDPKPALPLEIENADKNITKHPLSFEGLDKTKHDLKDIKNDAQKSKHEKEEKEKKDEKEEEENKDEKEEEENKNESEEEEKKYEKEEDEKKDDINELYTSEKANSGNVTDGINNEERDEDEEENKENEEHEKKED